MTRKSPPGREKLLAAAERLFAAQGFDAVSTKTLAQEAGVTIGALYHHFPSKDDVYRATLEYALAKLPPSPEPHGDAREQLYRSVAWYVEVIASSSDAARLLRRELIEPHLGVAISEFAVFAKPLADFRSLLREIAPDLNADMAIAATVSLIFGMSGLKGLRRVLPGLAPTLEDSGAIARVVTDIVLRDL